MKTHEDKPAPHWLRSYLGFFWRIVYSATPPVAADVAKKECNTVFAEYKAVIMPTVNDSHTVKSANRYHLLGHFLRASSDVDIAEQTLTEAIMAM